MPPPTIREIVSDISSVYGLSYPSGEMSDLENLNRLKTELESKRAGLDLNAGGYRDRSLTAQMHEGIDHELDNINQLINALSNPSA